MKNLKVAFDILHKGQTLPQGYTKASGHLVFDARMNLERKARWGKERHRTPEPEHSIFACVVSRENIRAVLSYASLNGLPVFGADIQMLIYKHPPQKILYYMWT